MHVPSCPWTIREAAIGVSDSAIQVSIDACSSGGRDMATSDDHALSELSPAPAANYRRCAFYLAATLVFLALAVYAAAGPRGTDQFWYTNDTMTLMAGKAPYTNTVFPGTLIRENMPPGETYFVHHTLTLYMAAAFGMIFGAYAGWIAMTVIATLAAAWLVSRAVRRLVDERAAVWAYALFLFWPVVFWQSVNVLQESLFAFFSAATVCLFVGLRKSLRHYLLLELLLLAGALCSPFFAPPLLLVPVAMLIHFGRPVRGRIVLVACGFLAIAAAALALKPLLFPAAFPSGLSAIIGNTDATLKNNMMWWGQIELPRLTLKHFWLMLVWIVQSQFAFDRTGLVFYWPVNVTLLALLILLVRPRGAEQRRLAGLTLLLLGLYGGVLLCHQNQFRYSLFILPATVPCAFVILARLGQAPALQRAARVATVVALVLFLAFSAMAARRLRAEAQQSAAFCEAVKAHFAELPDTQHVIVDARGCPVDLHLGFALYPRLVMIFVLPHEPDVYRQIRRRFPSRWLIAEKGSGLLQIYNADLQSEWRLPEPFSEFSLYRIAE